MNHTGRGSAVWLTLAFTFTLPLTARATAGQAVYTMSNALTGNEVLVFTRKPNGNLDPAGAFPTGGTGTGGGLGNQGGLVLDPSNRWLFVINAGSGSISSFRLLEEGLQLVEAVPSGGFRPLSLTVFGTLLYVLNEGDPTDPASADNITGFRIHGDGTLTLIPGATRSLSADKTSPARIGFNKEGTVLLVTEKATNRLTTYTVNPDGTPNAPLAPRRVSATVRVSVWRPRYRRCDSLQPRQRGRLLPCQSRDRRGLGCPWDLRGRTGGVLGGALQRSNHWVRAQRRQCLDFPILHQV